MKIRIGVIFICMVTSMVLPTNGQSFLNKLKKVANTISPQKNEENKPDDKQKPTPEAELPESFATPHLTANTKVLKLGDISLGKRYSSERLYVQRDGKCGFLDKEGNLAIDFKYDVWFIGDPIFSDGYCVVTRSIDNNKRYIIIDTKGNETIMPKSVFNMSSFQNGKAIVFDNATKTTHIYFVDQTGKKILPALDRVPKYAPADPEPPRAHCEGLAAFYDAASEGWGFYDTTGKVVIEPIYNKVLDFSEGLAAVNPKDQRTWHFIDLTGKKAFEAEFKNMPTPFQEGFTIVEQNDGKRYAIDKTGAVASRGFKYMTPFAEGYAFVEEANENKTSVVDKNFNPVRKLKDSYAFPAKDGYRAAVPVNGRTVLGVGTDYNSGRSQQAFTPDGTKVFGFYEGTGGQFSNFFDGMAYCYALLKSGESYKTGFINMQGEYVFIIE